MLRVKNKNSEKKIEKKFFTSDEKIILNISKTVLLFLPSTFSIGTKIQSFLYEANTAKVTTVLLIHRVSQYI